MVQVYLVSAGMAIGAVGVVTPLCFWIVRFVNGKMSSKVGNKECTERVLRLTERIDGLKESNKDRAKDMKQLVCARFDAIEKLIIGNKIV